MDQDNYEQIIMMGDFNGVSNTQIDKQPQKKGGKLPRILTEMMEKEQLVDVWRKWNADRKNFTYYSSSKKAFSRIDMIWVSKRLEVLTLKTEILPKVISDHNPVLWAIRAKKENVSYGD